MESGTPTDTALARESAARAALRRQRGEHARLRELDRGPLACPECGPGNPAAAEYGPVPRFVPVARVAQVDTASGEIVDPTEVVEWRPCYTCNPDTWKAWQNGKLQDKRRRGKDSDT